MRLAIDVMGGDFAPHEIISGVKLALTDFPEIKKFLLVGDQNCVQQSLVRNNLSESNSRLRLVHASQVVKMNEPSATAVRAKRDSSITVAAKLMKNKRAEAVVSAGHTGAAVASTVVTNRMLSGIDRPGIASVFPAPRGSFIMLDIGANVDCKPIHIAQYAIMGDVYARTLFHIKKPEVGILSIGGEDEKGNELTKESYKILRSLPINFVGNVEGHDLFTNKVDVVLCDGFVGNVVLKCCESLAKAISGILRENLKKSPVRMAGAFLSKNAFKELKELTDHEEYGGAPLLGINGICIIAHGSSSAKAIRNAIRVARDMLLNNYNERISNRIAGIDWKQFLPEAFS